MAASKLKDILIAVTPELNLKPLFSELEMDEVLGNAPTSVAPYWVLLVELREMLAWLRVLKDRKVCVTQCHVVSLQQRESERSDARVCSCAVGTWR